LSDGHGPRTNETFQSIFTTLTVGQDYIINITASVNGKNNTITFNATMRKFTMLGNDENIFNELNG